LRYRLSLRFEVLFALCSKELLKFDGVSGIGSEECVGNVSKERNKSNAKVQYNIEQHFRPDRIWEAALDLLARPQNHHSHECVDNITDTGEETVSESYDQTQSFNLPWNYTDDRGPAKPDSTAIEQTHVKTICSPFDLGQNLGIMFRDAGG
jgi:hypothetical protein